MQIFTGDMFENARCDALCVTNGVLTKTKTCNGAGIAKVSDNSTELMLC